MKEKPVQIRVLKDLTEFYDSKKCGESFYIFLADMPIDRLTEYKNKISQTPVRERSSKRAYFTDDHKKYLEEVKEVFDIKSDSDALNICLLHCKNNPFVFK